MNIHLSKRKIITILTIVLLIFNILVAIAIFVDIQIIKAPKTEVYIDILEVTSEEILIETTIIMSNPNSFEISFKDIEMLTYTKDNKKIGEIDFEGGKIPSDESKTFYSKDKFFFEEEGDFSIIKNRLTGEIGVSLLGFIHKTIPLDVSVIASLQEIIDSIDIPDINMELDLNKLTQEGIEFIARIELFNPMKIEFGIDEFSIVVKTPENEVVGSLIIFGDIIKPEESKVFTSKGSINYNAFDSNKIIFTLKGILRGKIAGLEKKFDISTDTELLMPDITEFIFKNEPIEFQIPVQFKLRIRGIIATVGFKMFNPSEIPLEGRNLKCCVYRLDGEQKILLGEKEMEPCKIEPGDSVCVDTEIIIPYRKYIFTGLLKLRPDWIVLNIDGYFSIAGTRQEFPISLNAYIDPTLIIPKKSI